MKKKLLLIVSLLSVALVLGLCSCGGPSPTETVDSFLTAVKSEDADSIAPIYSGKAFNFSEEFSDFDSEDDVMGKLMEETLMPKILDFDYTLDNEKIKDNKATVDVTFTTYNLGSALNSFMSDYMTQAFTLAFSDVSDEQFEKIALNIFKSNFESVEKNYTKTVTVSLTDKDGTWVIDEFDDEGDFFNAILGGMIESSKALEDAYNFE